MSGLDEEIRRLRRAELERPDDVETARRLDQALLRAGFRDEARGRVLARVRCPLRYLDLVALHETERARDLDIVDDRDRLGG